MKTEFRKLTLIARESQREALTKAMQELGLLHVEQESVVISDRAEELIHKQNLINRMIRLLEHEIDHEEILHNTRETKEDDVLLSELQQIEESIDGVQNKIEKLEKSKDRVAPWGDYHYSKFNRLIDNGLFIYLCRANKKKFEKLDIANAVVEAVNQFGQEVFFVVITSQKEIDASFESFPLPRISPSEIAGQLEFLNKTVQQERQTLQHYGSYLFQLKQMKKKTEDFLGLVKMQTSFSEHYQGSFISLKAWFPAFKERELVQFLTEQKVAWEIRAPQKGEDVPILMKNAKYPSLFEPITRIFELPNYYETDLTPFLAVFYPILFAYCLGDAGYGFIIAAITFIGYFTFLKDSRQTAILGFILGTVTLVMGLIKSGSLFGIMLLPDHPAGWIRKLSNWVLIPDDSSVVFNAFNVALMIGVIQIITGIIISVYNKLMYAGRQYAIAPLGKLLIVANLIWIFLADMQGLQSLDVLGDLRTYLLILGIVLVVFFHEPDISIPRRIGTAFMPLFFIFTGILGDILSYVRLFALGLASSVLGLVVNQIGMQIMEGGMISLIIGVIFLIFGHALNFGIAALGSFVHPLRLTFVEFYGNVGFMGKGLAYRPFSKSKQPI